MRSAVKLKPRITDDDLRELIALHAEMGWRLMVTGVMLTKILDELAERRDLSDRRTPRKARGAEGKEQPHG